MIRPFLSAVCLVVATLLVTASVGAAGADGLAALRQEIEALKAGQVALEKELAVLKRALQRAPQAAAAPAEIATVDLAMSLGPDAPVQGDPDAMVVLIEFSDYQCPYCARHFSGTLPALTSEYIDPGKIRYVLRDFPLTSIHPTAFDAAEAARCAGEQGRYWEMHARMFENQRALGSGNFDGHAEAIELDLEAFSACVESDRHAEAIRADMAAGEASGVRGTPTFFVAVADGEDGELKAVRQIRGARSFDVFKRAIDEVLEEQAQVAAGG